MSYILDALRRAEAQRSRGRLPGLHQSAAGGSVLAGPQLSPPRHWLPLIGLLFVAALLAVGVLSLRQPPAVSGTTATQPPASDAASRVANGSGAAAAQTTASGAEQAALLTLPRKAVLAERPAAAEEAPPEPQSRLDHVASPVKPPRANSAATAPTAAQLDPPVAASPPLPDQVPFAPPAAPSQLRAAPSPSPPQATAQVPVTSPTLPASTALAPARPPVVGAALPRRQELPADIQRSLPPIVVSGTVYSSDPAQRMLVVNGELWHEGDQIRPELVLEQIRRRDAVLRYRGLRFTVSP